SVSSTPQPMNAKLQELEMPTVTIVDYTGNGRRDSHRHAANLLAYTKSTRLEMTAGLLRSIQDMTDEEIGDELRYMAGTIPSSWEFVNVTFLIRGVTRACAQQITRSRHASYAMQSQRVDSVSGAKVTNPYPEDTLEHAVFDEA